MSDASATVGELIDAEETLKDEYGDIADAEATESLDLLPDERKLVTQPYDVSVRQLFSDVESNRILLVDIAYQREYVWDRKKASRLIESLLLNVPIPVCYFAESDDGVWEVVDGLQRTQSIVRFLSGGFKLSGLTVLAELNGKTFEQLPTRDQLRIESRTMRFVVVTNESHPDIKFDVFERLNTGSVKLTGQELRNSIYRGNFNEDLKRLSSNEGLRKALGRARDVRMLDEELVLRFLALSNNLAGYKPALLQFLNEYMRLHREESVPNEQEILFSSTMSWISETLGPGAFQSLREGKLSGSLNRALFDAVTMTFAFANRTDSGIDASLRKRHFELISDPAFVTLITGATADRTKMHGRIRAYSKAMSESGLEVVLPPGLEAD